VGAQDLHGWVADSKVTGIQLVSVENAGTLLNFQLKNFSSTSIAALVIATPDGNKHFADFSREELAPNAVYSLLIDSAAVADVKHAISLVALVRADGSAEGLQPEINFVRAMLIGATLETERLRRILTMPAFTKDMIDADLEDLNKRVGRKPASVEEAIASVREVRQPDLSVEAMHDVGPQEQGGLLLGVGQTREVLLRRLLHAKALPETESASLTARTAFMSELRKQYTDSSTRMAALLKRFQSLQSGGDNE
jgi:hypothetical protein